MSVATGEIVENVPAAVRLAKKLRI